MKRLAVSLCMICFLVLLLSSCSENQNVKNTCSLVVRESLTGKVDAEILELLKEYFSQQISGVEASKIRNVSSEVKEHWNDLLGGADELELANIVYNGKKAAYLIFDQKYPDKFIDDSNSWYHLIKVDKSGSKPLVATDHLAHLYYDERNEITGAILKEAYTLYREEHPLDEKAISEAKSAAVNAFFGYAYEKIPEDIIDIFMESGAVGRSAVEKEWLPKYLLSDSMLFRKSDEAEWINSLLFVIRPDLLEDEALIQVYHKYFGCSPYFVLASASPKGYAARIVEFGEKPWNMEE